MAQQNIDFAVNVLWLAESQSHYMPSKDQSIGHKMRNIHAYSGTQLDFILLCMFCLRSDQEKSTKDRGTLLDEWTNKRVDIPCQEAVWSDGVDFPLECNLDLDHLLCDLV